MKKTLHNLALGATLVGALIAGGCDRNDSSGDSARQSYEAQKTKYVFTAKRTEITPQYSESRLIENIVVSQYLPMHPEDIKLSRTYTKNDPEFNVFREHLTVEQENDPYRR